MAKKILVVGASRGIGAEVARHFAAQGHLVFGVSRSEAVAGRWIQADISTPYGISHVLSVVGDNQIDALLFMGGFWENGAFTDEFDFLKSTDHETRQVLAVNLVAPIEITKGVAKNLSRSKNPRAIFIGSLSGLDQWASAEVANTASKFGLRGAIQALRIALKNEKIGFTVVNPGNVETEEILADIREGRFPEQIPIPIADLISAIEWILSLSPSVEVGDVNLIQKCG
jgi:short-subunit dehydrogenase